MTKIPRWSKTGKAPNLSAKQWLRANGYESIADRIDRLEARWKRAGKKTRRDWWAVLAGTKDGRICIIDHQMFPIIAACRKRQGFEPSEDAVVNTRGEVAPAVRPTPNKKPARKAA